MRLQREEQDRRTRSLDMKRSLYDSGRLAEDYNSTDKGSRVPPTPQTPPAARPALFT